ncbi:MAG TPA: alanine racemase [Longimicrobiaceae bacterium]|nr:alanine racemase [Longimicrobiaceae bacterium]
MRGRGRPRKGGNGRIRLASGSQSAYTTALVSDPSTTLRSRAWVEVNLDRIRENALAVRRTVGADVGSIPMVKANAYGLGAAEVVRTLRATPALDGPWSFGVAAVAEGEALRREGWSGRVLVFSPTPHEEFHRAADARLTLCFSDVESVRLWADEAARLSHPLPFHVEVDTGMGRAGFPWADAAEWGPRVAEVAEGRLAWEGVFTHFHSADEPDPAPTERQWERFRSALAALPSSARKALVVHCANSAASVRRPDLAADAVRPGIFLYGGTVGAEREPAPVAAVRARLVRVADAAAGSSVGYGATHTARAPERWGTLSIGYADGIPRALWTGGGEALVRGQRVPIVGRISMDVTTVELSTVPDAVVGDVVTLIGRDGEEEITVDEVARRCGTISYEILTGLTPRLPRVYLGAAG